jgi:hypothetical protein
LRFGTNGARGLAGQIRPYSQSLLVFEVRLAN